MKGMTIKRWLLTGLVLLFIVFVFSYLNLSVSGKYEAQREGLPLTRDQLKDSSALKSEIEFQKKLILYLIVICFVLIYPVVFLKGKNK